MKRDNKGRFIKICLPDGTFFTTPSKSLAWFLGLFAADGCVRKTNGQMSISQSGSHGKKLIEYVAGLIGYRGKISKHNPKKERLFIP